ncbi:MAG: glycerophosphodiester phosphodiesterase, partial [Hymenobacteraceae bacterium]|nr:glycerophosphodiester phosphodiesterase [Hymenobacteraceae bacterium]MDX5394940.1 glycerophosphodiester phosphodiesterase [Hymenobacteraceae bacterium]MDX5443046.1 glycerophosphodiester phosphodiesterase [Hymenobacteraceae bacterium]MDX5510974.1 glycerophosphodiester phosphodiesterase [Hymenobacteraceae bacterium]
MSDLRPSVFDVQGHRGCRGLMPENTIPAFLNALELGVQTLELDTVISKDKQVVVSHEPFMSDEICLTPAGQEIKEADEQQHNLYQMPYKLIKQYDCGLKPHPRFPDQQKMAAYKPLLSEVITAAEAYAAAHQLMPVQYNIETKCTPAGDNLFHPEPEEFVDLLINELQKHELLSRCTIQSFDRRTLQIIKNKQVPVKLSLLVEDMISPEQHLQALGFTPDYYSPDFTLINEHLLQLCRQKNIQLLPWTVNEPQDMLKLDQKGVAGIITDYPDRAIH